MEEKNLYCLGIHFKCFYEQGINGQEFDVAEPCRICKYNKTCQLNWIEMHKELKEKTGICITCCIHNK